jgi:hypothetical protein
MRLQPAGLPAAKTPHRFTHPSLLALIDHVGLDVAPARRDDALDVTAGLALRVSPGLADHPAGFVTLRYGLELALFTGMEGMSRPAAALLAAHAAGSFLAVQPAEVRASVTRTPLVQACLDLAGALPDLAVLRQAWHQLREAQGLADDAALSAATVSQVERLWTLAAASESLLAQGGDDRLTLDPVTGLNRYGCAPYPRPDVIAFASCTASSIAARSFLAAEARRRTIIADAAAGSAAAAIEAASRCTARRLLGHFGVCGMADAMLVASGTDAALLITALIALTRPDEPITSILMSPAETGSGVPQAVQGRHFSSVAASGQPVQKALPIQGLPGSPALQTIALRDENGRPYAPSDIEAACEAAIVQAACRGHVILHAIDGSKTGLTAPDRAACRRLSAMFGDRLSIVIDACQVRIEPALVRGYVRDGFFVLVTGSKFFCAPGFCGAVLAPTQGGLTLPGIGGWPADLRAYATLADGLAGRRCPGLLLRWAAALESMQNFSALPVEDARAAINSMGAAVRAMLMRNERLQLVQAPRPGGAGWSDRGSVLTFAVRAEDGNWMSAEALRPLYLALAEDSSGLLAGATETERSAASIRCQIGQPVSLGSPAMGGLRIAFSADQLISGGNDKPALGAVFEKLGVLLRQ